MTRGTQYTNIMIVYLLIGCLLQAAAAPADTVAQTVVNEPTDAATKAASTAIGQTGAQLSTLIKETGATVKDFGSETTRAAEQAIRAGGRASLALGYLFSRLLNGLSATVATGSELLASGASTVNGALGGVPVIRVVSGGLNNLAAGLASTIGEVSQNARQSREKMIQTLREQLNNSDAAVAAAAAAGGDVNAGAAVSGGGSVSADANASAAAAAAADTS